MKVKEQNIETLAELKDQLISKYGTLVNCWRVLLKDKGISHDVYLRFLTDKVVRRHKGQVIIMEELKLDKWPEK